MPGKDDPDVRVLGDCGLLRLLQLFRESFAATKGQPSPRARR